MEREADFRYSGGLCITSKYLSRIIKDITGYTALDYIENYVVTEAKAMLNSTMMTVQQISDSLNFPSQSVFGKYFKHQCSYRIVGYFVCRSPCGGVADMRIGFIQPVFCLFADYLDIINNHLAAGSSPVGVSFLACGEYDGKSVQFCRVVLFRIVKGKCKLGKFRYISGSHCLHCDNLV